MAVRGHQYSPLIGWQGCEQSQRSIPHRKLMPECTNVTKHNCVLSNWETDEYGNQVLVLQLYCTVLYCTATRCWVQPHM